MRVAKLHYAKRLLIVDLTTMLSACCPVTAKDENFPVDV